MAKNKRGKTKECEIVGICSLLKRKQCNGKLYTSLPTLPYGLGLMKKMSKMLKNCQEVLSECHLN